jgi:hypothetical protein
MDTPQNVVLQAGKKEAVVVDKRNKVSKRVEKKNDDGDIDLDDL